ncbi:MAG: anaerobic magnesium-protoporphyrin IX monomethyl ester cyclase [Pseudohongiellaceae bacterium]|jgi:anaerobic magnesium-protoporphyrin IX monomethyl ester cyclase
MKISIVNPFIPVFQRNYAYRKTRRWQPISTAIVAAWLEEQQHPSGPWEIQFLDAHVMGWSHEELAERVRSFDPDVLYFSTERTDAWELPIPDLSYITDSFEVLFADGYKPQFVLVEGPHGSIYPDDLLSRLPQADMVLRGETEPVSFAVLDAIGKGSDPAEVNSVSSRHADGSHKHNPDEPNPLSYADFPSPAWHLLPMELYRDAAAPDTPFAMLETSRGCPMPCGYCYKQMFGDRQSKREPEQVLDEVQLVVEKYGVRRIMFQDQIFTLDRRHTTEICEGLIKRGLAEKIEWRCQTRLNGMKKELLQLMKDAGCADIYTGLETGSDEMQGEISKLTLDEFLEFREFGDSIGLPISPNFIFGLPGETKATAMESARFYHSLGIAVVPNVNITYPLTRNHTEAIERGELKGGSWEEVVDGAGQIGTGMDKATIDELRAAALRLNRVLRWKKRLWNLMGKSFGNNAAGKLLAKRRRGGIAAKAPSLN